MKAKRPARPKKPTPAAEISTASALAKLLDVTPQAVSTWLRRGDWPVRRSGPWSAEQIEEIRTWRSQLQRDRSAGNAGGEAGEEQKLKRERRRILRLKRRALEGSLISRQLLDAAMEALTRNFVNAIEDLERALPLQLAGMDAGQIEKAVAQRVRSMRETLASQKILELSLVDQKIADGQTGNSRGRPRAGSK